MHVAYCFYYRAKMAYKGFLEFVTPSHHYPVSYFCQLVCCGIDIGFICACSCLDLVCLS